MTSFLVLLAVICSLLLGLVVLVQNPKGGGLAVGFQGAQQIGGVQRTTDFLEKATWYLVIGMFLLCLLSASQYASERPDADATKTEAAGDGAGAAAGDTTATN